MLEVDYKYLRYNQKQVFVEPEPKAFCKSMQVTVKGIPCDLAWLIMAFIENICSIVLLMPDRKPFWIDGLMMLLERQNVSSREARMLCNSLPIVEDRTIGLKFDIIIKNKKYYI